MPVYGFDVNALTLPRRTGVENYLASLLLAMQREPLQKGERVLLYAAKEAPEYQTLPQGWEWKRMTFPLKQGWTHGRLSWELLVNPPDIFFSPAHELPLFHRRSKIVATIHDVAFARVPEVYPGGMNLRQEWAVRHAVRCADRLLAVSASTKKDLMELYGAKVEKVAVTPLAGACRDAVHRAMNSTPTYFLCVGRLEKKKNQKTIVQAAGDHHLILVGKDGFGAEEIWGAARAKEKVEIRGYVSPEELDALYANATALLVPSVYEGFGLMLLEAMQRGVSVICSDIPIFHEVAGDAALFVETSRQDAWRGAMDRLVQDADFRSRLVQKGLERAKEFSWEKTARLTWDVLRSLA